MKLFSCATLDVKFSTSFILRGMLYFLLTIPLLLILAEVVARSPLGLLLPAPSLDADNFLFDAKIHALEQQVQRDGRLDCLFIGSSVANSDIDPKTVEEVFLSRTGEVLHCYNIGIPAMTIENATALAEAIVPSFHPKVVIYAVLPRDIDHITSNADTVEQSDWVAYNRGIPSLNGWLLDHFHAWRYFYTWRYWLSTQNRTKMNADTLWLTAKGHQPGQGIREPYVPNLTMTPDRLHQTWVDPGHLQSVERLIALREKGVEVILLEGPAYHDPSGSDAETWQAYQNDYLPTLLSILETNKIPFWHTQEISLQIPKSHWYDWLHLNSSGAQTFSEWLGELMAENAGIFK